MPLQKIGTCLARQSNRYVAKLDKWQTRSSTTAARETTVRLQNPRGDTISNRGSMSRIDDYDNLTLEAQREQREAAQWVGVDEVQRQAHLARALDLSKRARKIQEHLHAQRSNDGRDYQDTNR